MKKFSFRLASLLQFRETQENEALKNLGIAQKSQEEMRQNRSHLIDVLRGSLLRRESLSQEVISPAFYQLEQNFITGTKQRIIQADQSLVRAGREVERALHQYHRAKKQVRMIQILLEKALANYKEEKKKEEQKESDEMVIMRTHLKEEIFE